MATLRPHPVDSTSAFLASLNKLPDTRFYVVEAPREQGGGYNVKDRENKLFVRSYSGRDAADDDCTALNRNPPARKPLFPVVASSCRISAPRHTTTPASNGQLNVIDHHEKQTFGPYYPEIARECAAKLNAAHEASTAISPAKIEACWKCGELCPSDGKCDPLHCAKCRRAKATSSATHVVTTLANDALVDLAAACADEIGRRLGSVPEPVRMVAAIEPVDAYFAELDAAVGAGAA